AYNKGDMMATREAAHRRVGFLPSIPAGAGPADEPQWRLFDAAARWAAEGGGPTESDAGVGHWVLKDGAPTKALSAQEYRDWVHEQVIADLWKKLRVLVSVVGASGLVALFFGLSTVTTGRVNEGLDKKIQEQAAPMIANLVYKDSPISKEVTKRLE